MRHRVVVLVLGSLLVPAAAPAVPVPPSGPPQAPRLLPGDAGTAAFARASDSWIVGASAPADRIARRFGARRLMERAAVYRVSRRNARAFAAALAAAHRYGFSEPDRLRRPSSFPFDPLTGSQWSLGAIRATALTPPPVTTGSPIIGIIEDDFDASHPEWLGAQVTVVGTLAPGFHGNAVSSTAVAPSNGRGIVGVWPGARAVIAPGGPSCSQTVRAIERAQTAGAAVLNMSYGFAGGCFAHLVATQEGFGTGHVLVAAAGNEYLEGNPQQSSPATDPHVITVGALNPDLTSAYFSNENDAIDVSAPGSEILVAVPFAADGDGVVDGYTALDGTSFAAPMVAAGAAWVWQERAGLHHTQLTDLIRTAARDLGPRGWEPRFGFGVFDLPLALRQRADPPDPAEPNDDIEWIDGRRFRGADPPIFRGRRTRRLRARGDELEDPVDVYRVLIARRSTVRITVRPTYGDPDLEVFSRAARTVYYRKRPRTLLAASRRSGRRWDAVTVANSSRGRRLVYVAVYPAGQKALDDGYRLIVKRVR
jgi:hypothetical protein